ncbi:MAG TPA: peptidoglycan-binding domain-containing protein [Terriglobia bacterium]
MSRASFVIMALSGILLVAPFAAAQECSSDCAQQSLLPMLNHEQVESVQIELLERGIVPVFSQDTEMDKAYLEGVIAVFQEVNNMPATGQLDAETMDALGIPLPKSAVSAPEIQRAKPSK